MDNQLTPQPSDVPTLNKRLQTEPLHVTLGEEDGEKSPLPIGSVSEFAILEPHVMARVTFPGGGVVKVPYALLHKDGKPLFLVMDEAEDLPSDVFDKLDKTFADAGNVNEGDANVNKGNAESSDLADAQEALGEQKELGEQGHE